MMRKWLFITDYEVFDDNVPLTTTERVPLYFS